MEGSPAAGSDILYSREEAKAYFREARAAARMPFIYLSGGVSNRRFEDARELPAEAGANFLGLLCGRATWKDGGRHFGAARHERIGKLAEKRRNPEPQRVNARLSTARLRRESYASGQATAAPGENRDDTFSSAIAAMGGQQAAFPHRAGEPWWKTCGHLFDLLGKPFCAGSRNVAGPPGQEPAVD